MNIKYISLIIVPLLILTSCKKDEPRKPTFNRRGKVTNECSIRQDDGLGPYEPLGVVTAKECYRLISKLCRKEKYKQIHRTKGHFARGKFGKPIMIGLCP